MAFKGEEHDCGGYTRRYYDEQWDLIISNDGDYYWRDKWSHTTYECDSSVMGTFLNNQLGGIVDKFDDEYEDGIWEDDNSDNE